MAEQPTHQPRRVIVGHCPSCREVVVIFNNFEVWPLVVCKCGWVGGAILHHTRFESGGVVKDQMP